MKECPECGDEFSVKASHGLRRVTCSIECQRKRNQRRHGRTRQGATNPNYKNGKGVGRRERAGERRWYAAIGTACCHPDCRTPGMKLILHHVVYEQHVRREGGDRWDVRNAATVCWGCHSSHHRRGSRVLPLAALSDDAFTFARELLGPGGAHDYLRRRYRGDDVRLDALDAEWQVERLDPAT